MSKEHYFLEESFKELRRKMNKVDTIIEVDTSEIYKQLYSLYSNGVKFEEIVKGMAIFTDFLEASDKLSNFLNN